MPKEAWGRAADAAADMSESETYLWDSVCSAGVSFCFLERGFRKVFLKDKEIFGKKFLRHARVRDTKRPREDRTLRRHDLKMN